MKWLIDTEHDAVLNYIQGRDVSAVDIQRFFEMAHTAVVNGLIKYYICRSSADGEKIFASSFEKADMVIDINRCIDTARIPQMCEWLHISYLNSIIKFSNGKISRMKSKQNLIETGSVYTREDISSDIVNSTLNNVEHLSSETKILDFACGTGRFYDAIIRYLSGKGFDIQQAICENVFAVDVDPVAINITRLKAIEYYGMADAEVARHIKNNIICRNALVKENLYSFAGDAMRYEDFDGLVACGFDAIVSNPPYLVLKPSRNKLGERAVVRTKNLVNYFRASGSYEYSVQGMLNYYQISIEAMLQMLKKGGELGVICPSTLFADVSATKLRKHLLFNNNVKYIRYYTESDAVFVNVTQATCIFYLTKGGKSDKIDIHSNGTDFLKNPNRNATFLP